MNYSAALAHFPKITYARYKKMAAYFSNLEKLWEAEIVDLVGAGLEESIAGEFLYWRDQNPTEKIYARLEAEGIKTVSINDAGYPKRLKEINDPPLTIFYRGLLPDDAAPALAIVGTRKMTAYGKQVCYDLARALAGQGLIIISGLALGIDGMAHQGALDAHGQTVAVLGSGIDKQHIYPSYHKPLAEKIIAEGGAVLSEYPPGFMPAPYTFPARNRIVAGLSLGVLVVEAPEESGALITAKCALDYNREVFAIPHSLTSPTGAGPNNLIKMGAKLVTSPKDIIETLNLQEIITETTAPQAAPALTNEQEKIFSRLSAEPKNIDLIIKESGLGSATVSHTLLLMEMAGRVKNLGGMNYVAARRF
jgi:DNA processing protein